MSWFNFVLLILTVRLHYLLGFKVKTCLSTTTGFLFVGCKVCRMFLNFFLMHKTNSRLLNDTVDRVSYNRSLLLSLKSHKNVSYIKKKLTKILVLKEKKIILLCSTGPAFQNMMSDTKCFVESQLVVKLNDRMGMDN